VVFKDLVLAASCVAGAEQGFEQSNACARQFEWTLRDVGIASGLTRLAPMGGKALTT
jgi:hypothetical protein